jgi:hypothetical protein
MVHERASILRYLYIACLVLMELRCVLGEANRILIRHIKYSVVASIETDQSFTDIGIIFNVKLPLDSKSLRNTSGRNLK